MKKSEFKEKIDELLDTNVDNLTQNEKFSMIRQRIVEFEKNTSYDSSNKGKSWSDDELRVILKTSPTKENCMLLAKAFRRGYGSIEQIFRWAAEDQTTIDRTRPDDIFIKQIKKIAKEIGWRAT
ncbi:MAG: hypothetical protein LUM44_01780 [Pyrinomonadaceae bacterium]|nr:hypothetical protein [Pyrinomonadaceae bacterium]